MFPVILTLSEVKRKDLKSRILRSFAVFAAQDDSRFTMT